MAKRVHMIKRMSQRGVRSDVVDIVVKFGIEMQRERIILNRKTILALKQNLLDLERALARIDKCGGYISTDEWNLKSSQ